MRRFVIGSHHLLAHGLRDTLEFLTSKDNITDISAYMDDSDVEEQIARVDRKSTRLNSSHMA